MINIATSKVIIVDGYNLPVSLLKHKKGTKVIDNLNLEIKDSKVTGVDISNDALETAKKNNGRLGANVNFYLSDCFDEVIKRKETYQIIVSNPPYIAS